MLHVVPISSYFVLKCYFGNQRYIFKNKSSASFSLTLQQSLAVYTDLQTRLWAFILAPDNRRLAFTTFTPTKRTVWTLHFTLSASRIKRHGRIRYYLLNKLQCQQGIILTWERRDACFSSVCIMPHNDGRRGVETKWNPQPWRNTCSNLQMTKTRTQETGAVDTYNSPKYGRTPMRLAPSNGEQDTNKQRKMRIN